MKLYFLLLEPSTLREIIAPALSASWRQRSFLPCRQLCADLRAAVRAFVQPAVPDQDVLLEQIAGGRLPFDYQRWRCLAGLVLLYAAVDLPQVLLPAATLCCLLAREHYLEQDTPRQQFAPIQQVLFGSRDLTFGGGYYRPEHAGYNDSADVARLADYLAAVDPRQWTAAHLADLREITDEGARADELAYVQEWFPDLAQTYRRAADRGLVLVCERL